MSIGATDSPFIHQSFVPQSSQEGGAMEKHRTRYHFDAPLLQQSHTLATLRLTGLFHRSTAFYALFNVAAITLLHLKMSFQPHDVRKVRKTLGTDLLPERVRGDYDVAERHHACAILHTDFRSEWDDLIAALLQLRLPKTQILAKGGRKSPISIGINGFFYKRGWQERSFKIQVTVDDEPTLSPTTMLTTSESA